MPRKSIQKQIDKLQVSFDTYANLLAGIGTDNDSANNYIVSGQVLDYGTRQAVWEAGGIVTKAIDIPVDDCFKYDLIIDHAKAEEINKTFHDLDAYNQLALADKTDRVHGGSALIIDDGMDLDQPLVLENIKSLSFFVLSNQYLQPQDYKPFCKTEYFIVNKGSQTLKVHHSKIILFDGIDRGIEAKLRNNGFGFPWLSEPIHTAGIQYTATYKAYLSLLKEVNVGVVKVKGLNEMMANKETMYKALNRAKLLKSSRSYTNDILIDSDDEYQRYELKLAGLNQSCDASENTFAALVNIPKTRLYGQNPQSGLGNAGQSQLDDYYDSITTRQNKHLRPKLAYLLLVISAYLNITEEITFSFKPLYQLNDLDRARVNEIQSNVDKTYYEMGQDGEEIVKARYGSGKYTPDAPIKPKMRPKPETPKDTPQPPTETTTKEKIDNE